jgi:hypothetical protein
MAIATLAVAEDPKEKAAEKKAEPKRQRQPQKRKLLKVLKKQSKGITNV